MWFNINYEVKIRLTDVGRKAHRKNHDDLFADWKEPPRYSPPVEDAEGWSTWQLWVLMHEFGPYLFNGCNVPFETTIEIPEGQH